MHRKIGGNYCERGGSYHEDMRRNRRRGRQKEQWFMRLLSVVLLVATYLLGAHYVSASGIRKELGNRTEEKFEEEYEQISYGQTAHEGLITLEELAQQLPTEVVNTEPGNTGENGAVPAQEQQTPENHNLRVAIDAGHGGMDDGCVRDGVTESDINLQLACRLAEKLEAMGFEVVMVREGEEKRMSLEERVKKAEEQSADIYVSIHQNSYGETDNEVKGIETWYNGESEDSRRLARLVHKYAVDKAGASDREVRETDELYVVCKTSIPSCLIETGFLSNREEREALLTESYQNKLAEGIAQGISYYFNPKTMYLTFDDGPSAENTTVVLDILKEKNIKATFFVVGENVRRYPDVARRIVEDGHTIGIHCDSHVYTSLYASVDSYLADFQKAYDTVYETTGVEVQLFRFPGGSVNSYNKNVYKDIIKAMTEKGYIYFDWNASLEDAVKNSTPEGLLKNALNTTLGRKKVVMLAHDVIYNTTQCLEELLDSFPEYQMEPLTPDVEPIQFRK